MERITRPSWDALKMNARLPGHYGDLAPTRSALDQGPPAHIHGGLS